MKNCTAACSSCSNENKYCLDELTWKWASVDPRQVKTVISILSISPTFTSYWLVGQESADGESFLFQENWSANSHTALSSSSDPQMISWCVMD